MGRKKKADDTVKIEKAKRTYELWIEYLKENDEYKYRCELSSEGFSEFIDRNKRKLSGELVEMDLFGIAEAPSDEEIYKRICQYNSDFAKYEINDAIGRFWSKHNKTYNFFGNIHASDYDFEVWWKEYAMVRIEKKDDDSWIIHKIDKGSVSLYANELIASIDEDEIGLDLIKEHFSTWHGEREGRLTLLVNTNYPLAELGKVFNEIIQEHKERYGITPIKEKEYANRMVPSPITARQVSELATYINVHKFQKNGMKYKDIVRTIQPNSPYIDEEGRLDETGRRMYLAYNQKAKRIINNVGEGIFPGEY